MLAQLAPKPCATANVHAHECSSYKLWNCNGKGPPLAMSHADGDLQEALGFLVRPQVHELDTDPRSMQ